MSEFLHVVYTFSASNVDESGQVRLYINGNLADQKLKHVFVYRWQFEQ